MTTLTLDNREGKLIALLRNVAPHIPFVCENLALGDVRIAFGAALGAPTQLVIERKTIADLAASIKDGRYHEQKQRLLAAAAATAAGDETVLLAYVLEGGLDADPASDVACNGVRHSALQTCVLRMALRDRIAVFQTASLLETAHLVTGLVNRLRDAPEKYVGDGARGPPSSYKPTTVKTTRRDNIDARTSFLMQLCAIPSVSFKTAEVLSDALGVASMAALVDLLRAEAGQQRLLAVPRIGKTMADKVREFVGMPPAAPPEKKKKKEKKVTAAAAARREAKLLVVPENEEQEQELQDKEPPSPSLGLLK